MRNERTKRPSLISIYDAMQKRCENPNHNSYKYYGARGISICPEWRADHSLFRAWAMENGYREGLQIDRIDNNLGYSAENCRWVTQAENNRNRRSTKLNWQKVGDIREKFARGNVSKSQLAREYGVVRTTICAVIRRKSWDI